jgi:zinc protease
VLDGVSVDDLRAYHAQKLAPSLAMFHVAGAIAEADVTAALQGISARWSGTAPELPGPPVWDPTRSGLYFVDVPNASQSVLNIGYLALRQTDDDFWPARILNFRLGGGGFASELLLVLREGKGYTYGIGSNFSGTTFPGPFLISSSVRSNVTLESLTLIKDIVSDFGPEFDAEDLASTQGFLLKANAGAFETLGDKLGLLSDMSTYGFPADYVIRREDVVRAFTVDDARRLATRYLDPAQMVWVVVGDANTQRSRLSQLGLGAPVTLDREGRRVP